MEDIKILSWNCQGFKSNGPWLHKVLHNYDIIALQETWLLDTEQILLDQFDPNYYSIHKSGMPKTFLTLRGRPYGGVGFLIRKSLQNHVKTVMQNDSRLISISFATESGEMLVTNVYFPVNSINNEELIVKYISKIEMLVSEHNGYSVVCGDFNLSSKSALFKDIQSFCENNEHRVLDIDHLPAETFTFCSKGNGSTSWIDHFIVSNDLCDISKISILNDHSSSDHVPIFFSARLKFVERNENKNSTSNIEGKINWRRMTIKDKDLYRQSTHHALEKILANKSICTTPLCNNVSHNDDITSLYQTIVNSLKGCALILQRRAKSKRLKAKPVTGWNDRVKTTYQTYRNIYRQWVISGRCDSNLYNDMTAKRKFFKKALKLCRKKRESIIADRLATEFDSKDFYKFWSSVKAQDGLSKECLTDKLEGVVGESDICEYWARHYESTFTSNKDATKQEIVNKYISNCHTLAKPINSKMITQVIKELKAGKAAGPDAISAEHCKLASPLISDVVALLLESSMCHGYIPQPLMQVKIVPILKKKGLDRTIANNYRPIALATAISKIYECVLLSINASKLSTVPNQFGYKKKVGTEMAIFVMKMVAHNYLRNDSPVYICYMDATKAFDLVNHWVLLDKLCQRGCDRKTLEIFRYWFRNQFFIVQWGKTFSRPFPVRNSIRQGGCSSSQLFSVYMDNLSKLLSRANLGCHVGETCINNINFADDIALLATSISGLKTLLAICEAYAAEHSIIFNPKKTVCQAFVPRTYVSSPPEISLSGQPLNWSDNVRYLGYDMSCWERDAAEIMRRRRDLYVRASLISSRFYNCSVPVKKYLFNTYFGSIYCMSLWVPVSKMLLHKVKVAYNDAFRAIFKISRRASASGMFATNGIKDFTAIYRRAAYSLLCRIASSDNLIVSSIYNSNVFILSSIYKAWCNILLTPNQNPEDFIELFNETYI